MENFSEGMFEFREARGLELGMRVSWGDLMA